MLELILIADFPAVLKEFHRVLRKDGRLILVNLIKKEKTPIVLDKLNTKVDNRNPCEADRESGGISCSWPVQSIRMRAQWPSVFL